MVVDADGRTCECGCGEPIEVRPGRPAFFATDACRQRAHRAAAAEVDAIDIWDALKIVGERAALSCLSRLPAAARQSLRSALAAEIGPVRDGNLSRPLARGR